MPDPGTYKNLIPLGRLTVSAASATTLLSANIGPQQGQVGTQTTPGRAGAAFRQMRLAADKGNTGQVFLMPRGLTVSANPGAILAVIGPGQQITIPDGVMAASGFLPENYCLDTDTAGSVVYGMAVTG